MSEQELIDNCLKGCSKFQKILLERYSPLLFAICKRYIGQENAASYDLLQESFIKIFNNLESYNPKKGKFSTWCTRITVNTCLNHLTANKNYRFLLPVESINNLKTPSGVLSSLTVEELTAEIEKLPFGMRTVFNMHVIDGFSHKEISDKLNIRISSSRARLTRAKQQLRTNLLLIKPKEKWIN